MFVRVYVHARVCTATKNCFFGEEVFKGIKDTSAQKKACE